jgi:hypothetical protein
MKGNRGVWAVNTPKNDIRLWEARAVVGFSLSTIARGGEMKDGILLRYVSFTTFNVLLAGHAVSWRLQKCQLVKFIRICRESVPTNTWRIAAKEVNVFTR